MPNRISIPVDLCGLRRHLSLVRVEADLLVFNFLLVSTQPLNQTSRPLCFSVPPEIVDLLAEELDTLPAESDKAADLHQEPYIDLTHLWSFLDQI